MAAHAAACRADLQENWTAEDHPPLDACLERVRKADLLVVIVAHRFGWVPEDNGRNPDGKSITWLECEEANHVLAFVVDDNVDWPEELKDEADLKRAGNLDDEYAGEALYKLTRKKIRGLKAFKQWLGSRGLRETFCTKEEFRVKVAQALNAWRSQQPDASTEPQLQETGPPSIPFAYLAWLRRECESVELLGLEAQENHPTRLSQVYVPALTPADRIDQVPEKDQQLAAKDRPQFDLLLSRLGQESLYLPGDPGAGKSTFCRWLTLVAASEALPIHPVPDPEKFRESYPELLRDRLPVLIPLREFWSSLPLERGSRHLGHAALATALGEWLERWAGAGCIDCDTFTALLQAGLVLLILDGVDEVPLSDGIEQTQTYPRACLLSGLSEGREAWTSAGNRMLVTSRPYGLREDEIRRLGLPEAPLLALEEEIQSLFIRRWYAAADPDNAEEKAAGLIDHLVDRGDLTELKQNPMLLTALCVRYGEGRRLPQDRHDLYDKIVNNVLFNRYRGEEHERDAVRGRLAAIALGMHTGENVQLQRTTPETAVSLDEVEGILGDYAETNPATEAGRAAAAQRRDELLTRSGLLIARRESKAGFYHFSFQEFLAAEHLARSRREPDWFDSVVAARAPVAEWRLTLGFLFGRMMERNGQQWALEAAERLLANQNRSGVRNNPATAVVCADWLEILQRKRLNLGNLKKDYARLALQAIEDEIRLQDRFRLAAVLGLVGDPRLGDSRNLEWQKQGLIEVPAERYAYQDDYQQIDQSFRIGRYPVTNSQFAIFMDDGGYRESHWWSKAGLVWLKNEEISEPSYWNNSRLNTPNQPVVGISFWEADAFCRWAGCRLPTEQEWEAAARGRQGHEYPWGEPWEDGICNTGEAGLRRTSPVGLFPRARQKELGIEDLAGNVWEWCLNKYLTPEDTALDGSGELRVLRGGSWLYDPGGARSALRDGLNPAARNDNFGFRVVCSGPL